MKQSFQDTDMKKWRIVNLERGEQTRWALEYPCSLPWKNFQAVAQGGGNQEELSQVPKLKRQSWKSGRTGGKDLQDKVLEERELHGERTLQVCRGSFLRIQQCSDQHMCVRGLLEARERMTGKDYSRVSQPWRYWYIRWKFFFLLGDILQ